MELVVDASAVVASLAEKSPAARDLLRRLEPEGCHAPQLIDAEMGNAFRRMAHTGELDAPVAEGLLIDAHSMIDFRWEMTGAVATAAWALRQNLSFYDALYVGLATLLGVPLLTADERLARAPGLPCAVELVG